MNQQMQVQDAARMLAAIGHPLRLQIYRMLVQAGPGGRAAGELASALDTAPSSLSFHLKEMVHAGLLKSSQQGRNVFYAVVFDTMADLMRFLAHDCCAGNPCLPVSFGASSATKTFPLSVMPDQDSEC